MKFMRGCLEYFHLCKVSSNPIRLRNPAVEVQNIKGEICFKVVTEGVERKSEGQKLESSDNILTGTMSNNKELREKKENREYLHRRKIMTQTTQLKSLE